MTVVKFRDGTLVVPARVRTSDEAVADGVRRIDRRHPLFDAWWSYCDNHPEDVDERRRIFGETGEDLVEGLQAACGGLLVIGALAAIDLSKGLVGVDVAAAAVVGCVLWVCFFIAGVVYSRRSRERAEARLRSRSGVEVEQPPGK